jgi:hypothetical protein
MLADLVAGRQHIFQSIRIWRQQLGRRDVRPREQGFDALSGWAPRVLTRTKISFGRTRCKSIPVGRVWVRFAKYNLLIRGIGFMQLRRAPCTRILLMRTHGYAATREPQWERLPNAGGGNDQKTPRLSPHVFDGRADTRNRITIYDRRPMASIWAFWTADA